jgi:hypothetical protein
MFSLYFKPLLGATKEAVVGVNAQRASIRSCPMNSMQDKIVT